MKKLAAVLSATLFCSAALVAPVFASTEANNAEYTKHQADCLVLLFTNPKAHAEQCGDNLHPAPPPSSSTGFSCPKYGEIIPYDIYGRQMVEAPSILVAGSGCCGAEWTAPTTWEDLWNTTKARWSVGTDEVLLAAC